MRTHTKIRIHYNQLLKLRKRQTLALFDILIQKGILRSEQFKNEYENLYVRIQILGDFWMSSASIQETNISKNSTSRYSTIIMETIYPYLTPNGVLQYKSILKSR